MSSSSEPPPVLLGLKASLRARDFAIPCDCIKQKKTYLKPEKPFTESASSRVKQDVQDKSVQRSRRQKGQQCQDNSATQSSESGRRQDMARTRAPRHVKQRIERRRDSAHCSSQDISVIHKRGTYQMPMSSKRLCSSNSLPKIANFEPLAGRRGLRCASENGHCSRGELGSEYSAQRTVVRLLRGGWTRVSLWWMLRSEEDVVWREGSHARPSLVVDPYAS